MNTTNAWIFALTTTFAIGIGCGGVEPMDEFDAQPDDEFVETSDPLLGSDACKNTDINISNDFVLGGTGREIKILKVEYYSASEGGYRTEDLTNDTIAYGSSRWWWNEDLAHAENDLLTKWKIHFKYKELDGDWSDAVYQVDNTPDDICLADDNYYLTVD